MGTDTVLALITLLEKVRELWRSRQTPKTGGIGRFFRIFFGGQGQVDMSYERPISDSYRRWTAFQGDQEEK